jgi:tetratricopeptide (TPR) repeat protein
MFRINVSGAELFELIRPAALVLWALLSTWVLVSALKRFAFLTSILWAIATFFLPLIVGPLYVAVIIFRSRRNSHLRSRSRRWLFALAYGLLLLTAVGVYLVRDGRSVDAYLARASQAKVKNDRAGAIREYRSALSIENNAHTHKLLAIELADAGLLQEAVDEFRLARSGGEPDDSISYRIGELLEKMNRPEEAANEYRKFVASEMCSRNERDSRCETAAVKETRQ